MTAIVEAIVDAIVDAIILQLQLLYFNFYQFFVG